jgi:hypothetical protein
MFKSLLHALGFIGIGFAVTDLAQFGNYIGIEHVSQDKSKSRGNFPRLSKGSTPPSR